MDMGEHVSPLLATLPTTFSYTRQAVYSAPFAT